MSQPQHRIIRGSESYVHEFINYPLVAVDMYDNGHVVVVSQDGDKDTIIDVHEHTKPPLPDFIKKLRLAWEAGFQLCRGYADNHQHFQGEQKERQWQEFLKTLE